MLQEEGKWTYIHTPQHLLINPLPNHTACWCIKNISNNSDDNKRRFGPLAAELVVAALRAFPADEGVLREGKAALRNLSNNNPENRARIEQLEYRDHLTRAAASVLPPGQQPGQQPQAPKP